jgi:hypothetical protein
MTRLAQARAATTFVEHPSESEMCDSAENTGHAA